MALIHLSTQDYRCSARRVQPRGRSIVKSACYALSFTVFLIFEICFRTTTFWGPASPDHLLAFRRSLILLAGDGAPAISVSDGATVEIDGASTQSVAFLGTSGALLRQDASGFTGQVSGLAEADALDLADVHYGANTTAAFSGNANGGTLTITDGSHTAQIAMLGDYLGSGWTLSSDGNGGTVVVDPSLYPNGTNTGVSAGVKLTPYNGTLTLSTPGQVVSGLIISNGVQIDASNVTLENCIIDISNSGGWNIGVEGGLTGVNIENCEIVGAGLAGPVGTYGIYVQGNSQVTINADNIHDVGQGVVMNETVRSP